MTVRMRHTHAQTKNRRSHHALKEPRLSRDSETGSHHLRHRVDMKTGMYRGRQVFEVENVAAVEAEAKKAAPKTTPKKEVVKEIKAKKEKVTSKVNKSAIQKKGDK